MQQLWRENTIGPHAEQPRLHRGPVRNVKARQSRGEQGSAAHSATHTLQERHNPNISSTATSCYEGMAAEGNTWSKEERDETSCASHDAASANENAASSTAAAHVKEFIPEGGSCHRGVPRHKPPGHTNSNRYVWRHLCSLDP